MNKIVMLIIIISMVLVVGCGYNPNKHICLEEPTCHLLTNNEYCEIYNECTVYEKINITNHTNNE